MKEHDVSVLAPVSQQLSNDAESKSNAIDKRDGGRLLSELIMQPAKIERFPDRHAQQQSDCAWRYLAKLGKEKTFRAGLRRRRTVRLSKSSSFRKFGWMNPIAIVFDAARATPKIDIHFNPACGGI